jgi:polar amino acid transport system ATP-binding protein
MTMVLATHEMQFARHAADKICFLKDGKIIEEGPPDQIFGSPKRTATKEFLARALK